MKLTNEQKTQLGFETIQTFWDQFGENDLCKQVLLEILLEELHGQTLSISGSPRQKGNQDFDNQQGTMPTYEID